MKQASVIALLIISTISIVSAWPRKGRSDDGNKSNFIGEATNDLSTAILQSYVDDDSNLAFSPLGYSLILAILSEGAKGDTYTQLSTALKLPKDSDTVRLMFQGIMERLRNTNEYKPNSPEFKNWFYVYKNYTVNEDYRKILEKYYLTDVKSVTKYDTSFFHITKEPTEETENKKVGQIEPLPSVEIKDPIVKDIKETSKVTEKDVEITTENESTTINVMDEKKDEKIISFAMEDKPEKVDFEKHTTNPGKNIKEKIKLTNGDAKKTHEAERDFEIMEAVEARSHQRTAKGLFERDEVTNGLSSNRVGNKDSSSIMILFNGLYFRGTWKTPFEKIDDGVFYRSVSLKKSLPMMKASGKFKTGSLPGLDSTAIELPYEGDRYALVIVKPRTRDGLRRLAADLAGLPPSRLPALLETKDIEVKLPIFYVETTTKPLSAFAKFGVSSIFSPEADLSGISPVGGLFVQEMVQHVSVKVDSSSTGSSHITASNPSILLERSQPLSTVRQVQEQKETFVVDHPFLFFVRDVVDNIIVVAGKVTDPDQSEML